MSLNFSSPLFLYGLLGIAVPVLIHLLTRRQQKHIRFSAVYLLIQSQKRSTRKSRPNRLLLLLARCLAITLFSLALADPFFSFRQSEAFLRPASIVFVLDDSYSMGVQAGKRTLFAHALEFVFEGTKQAPEKSEYSLVLASSPARIEQDWTSDKTIFEKTLKAQSVSFRTTHIGDAIDQSIKLLDSARQEKKKIFLLTDLDKNGWKEEAFSKFTHLAPYPVKVLNFSSLQSDDNKGMVKSVQISQEFLTRSRLLRVKVEIRNFSNILSRRPLSLFLEGKIVKEELLDIPPGQTLVQEFSYPLRGNQTLNGKVQVSDDALTTDNSRYFSFHPSQNIKVMVVDGDPETISHQSESFYLERALNPFSVSLSHIDPTISTLAQLPLRNLSEFSVVILANVRELSPDYELELEKFVLNGGALLFGMGDQVNPKYFNERLGNLLPIILDSQYQVKEGAPPLHLLLKNNTHPVMKVFSPKELEEMREINFYSMYTVQAREDKIFKVGTWFSNQNPAVIESNVGKGIVVLFLSSLDRDWNDFPIQPTFLPWIQRWTQYSARGLDSVFRQSLLVGEPFRKSTSGSDSNWIVHAPDGTLHILENEVFSNTFQPGIYHLFFLPFSETSSKTLEKIPDGAEPAGTFTVNIDVQESEPGKISQK